MDWLITLSELFFFLLWFLHFYLRLLYAPTTRWSATLCSAPGPAHLGTIGSRPPLMDCRRGHRCASPSYRRASPPCSGLRGLAFLIDSLAEPGIAALRMLVKQYWLTVSRLSLLIRFHFDWLFFHTSFIWWLMILVVFVLIVGYLLVLTGLRTCTKY